MPEVVLVTLALWVFFGPVGHQVRGWPLGTTALELGLAAALAAVLGVRNGWTVETVGATAAALWPLVYVVSCMRWPMRRCLNPGCSRRRPRDEGGGGVFRPRPPCRWCGGRDFPRFGTRLFLGGGRDD